MGVPVEQLNKIGEGSPHVVDRIRARRRGPADQHAGRPRRARRRLGDPARRGRARHPLHHDDDRRIGGRQGDRRRAGRRGLRCARFRSCTECGTRAAALEAGAQGARAGEGVSGAEHSPAEVEVGLAAPEPGPRVLAPFGRRCVPRSARTRPSAPTGCVGRRGPRRPRAAAGPVLHAGRGRGLGRGRGRAALSRPRLLGLPVARHAAASSCSTSIGPGTDRLARARARRGDLARRPARDRLHRARTRCAGRRNGARCWSAAASASRRSSIWARGADRVRSRSRDDAARLSLARSREPRRSCFGDACQIATDDGSAGHHGLVTELLEAELEQRRRRASSTRAGRRRCSRPCAQSAHERAVPASSRWRRRWRAASAPASAASCERRPVTGGICVDGPVDRAGDLDETWLER